MSKRPPRGNGKVRVGILGATGMVGQRFAQLLEHHPDFVITAMAASDKSVGKCYAEATRWRLAGDMPEGVRGIKVQACEPPLDCDVIFASLPGDIAREVEGKFAAAGYPVITNSSAYRMDDGVPLIIPEINADHLKLLDACGEGGYIVTNPNCSAVVVTMALAPLHRAFGIESAIVTTMQAISGAGYPGVASLDITDNLVPYIGEEEEKIERESNKMMGMLAKGRVTPAPFALSAQVHRVNVTDGHTVAIRVKLAKDADPKDLARAFAEFRGSPAVQKLPSAPAIPIVVRNEPDRPQPRLDRDAGKGMAISVGRIQRDKVLSHRFVALGHNTIRGAAGGAIMIAELLKAEGRI